MLLEFSLSGMITEALSIVTSLIDFIKSNALLIGLLGVGIVIPLVFSIISYIRSRLS